MVNFTINLHHDGCFVTNPLHYLEGDHRVVEDIDFEGVIYSKFCHIIRKLVIIAPATLVNFSKQEGGEDHWKISFRAQAHSAQSQLDAHNRFLVSFGGSAVILSFIKISSFLIFKRVQSDDGILFTQRKRMVQLKYPVLPPFIAMKITNFEFTDGFICIILHVDLHDDWSSAVKDITTSDQ
ncbi:hypothetical protein Tco_0641448 [Tanacetum coccineum]